MNQTMEKVKLSNIMGFKIQKQKKQRLIAKLRVERGFRKSLE